MLSYVSVCFAAPVGHSRERLNGRSPCGRRHEGRICGGGHRRTRHIAFAHHLCLELTAVTSPSCLLACHRVHIFLSWTRSLSIVQDGFAARLHSMGDLFRCSSRIASTARMICRRRCIGLCGCTTRTYRSGRYSWPRPFKRSRSGRLRVQICSQNGSRIIRDLTLDTSHQGICATVRAGDSLPSVFEGTLENVPFIFL